ncbi:very-short-patch-repair endonuclease [Mycetocola sp. CAN_C7]|uniref:endonuclease domain-containing protein n=1 Tax=Mycetocola sp. CAN_C7 TaxID=2787724 RepID=UPI0018C95602
MDLESWLNSRDGIAHRADAVEAGYTRYRIAAAVSAGRVRVARRHWLYTRGCPADLVTVAAAGGRLTCVSETRRLGLWTISDGRLHVSVAPNAALCSDPSRRLHWSAGPVPVGPRHIAEPLGNVLAHVADCQPFERAVVVFESALRTKKVVHEELSRYVSRSAAFRLLIDATGILSDSGIESLPKERLRRIGIEMRQQVVIDGHPVDGVIGSRLLLQVDGFGPHSAAERRRRDLRQDARLTLMGYTVLRFDYTQIMFDWPFVEATILAAMAQGLHLAA